MNTHLYFSDKKSANSEKHFSDSESAKSGSLTSEFKKDKKKKRKKDKKKLEELVLRMNDEVERLGQENAALKKKNSSLDMQNSMKIHANFVKFAGTIQKFSGKGMSIDRWFKHVEQSALTVISGVLEGSNPMFVLCILSALEGGALKWVQSYQEKVGLPDSWVELKKVLWCQFKDTNHVFEQIRRLGELKCSDELKIGDHCIKFNDLVLSISDPAAILRYFFFTSLPTVTQEKLGLETDASLVEMQAKAQKLIRVAKVMSGGSQKDRKSEHPPRATKRAKLGDAGAAKSSQADQSFVCHDCGEHGHARTKCPASAQAKAAFAASGKRDSLIAAFKARKDRGKSKF